MLEAIQSLFTLRWTTKQPQLRPLPPHIKRTYVSTPGGDLELLICEPRSSTSTIPSRPSPPIFFAHGGYGTSTVYLEWMTHLYNAGYSGPLYACSLRNHGGSYGVSYFKMVFRTSVDELAGDLVACIEQSKLHSQSLLSRRTGTPTSTSTTANVSSKASSVPSPSDANPILVGHSAGGGLSQYALSKSLVSVRALCLVGAIPHFGNGDVYYNWWKHDRWFPLRMLVHLYHPTSPLSSANLVYGAFFGPKYPRPSNTTEGGRVSEFMKWMPNYESMGWPTAMMGNVWKFLTTGRSEWLSPVSILKNLTSVRDGRDSSDKVCVLVGSKDMMMDLTMCKRQAQEYRDGLEDLKREKKIDTVPYNEAANQVRRKIEGVSVERAGGVRLVVVKDAGHHVQNDIQCDEAAEALMDFAQQA